MAEDKTWGDDKLTHKEKNAIYKEMAVAVAEVGKRHPRLSPPEGVLGCCGWLLMEVEAAYAGKDVKGHTCGDLMISLLESLADAGADVSKINRVPMPKEDVEA